MQMPNCCGSEDGQLSVGVDAGIDGEAMVHVWKCNTCGVMTIVSAVVLSSEQTQALGTDNTTR